MGQSENFHQEVTAAIITIGDEILIGQIVDTNSAWIAKEFNKIGVRVAQIYSIADRREAIISTLKSAFDQYDLLILTGGLGPTKDDITKLTLADYFNTPLVCDQKVYSFLEQMLAQKGIDFNPLNQAQALVPQSCVVLQNDVGTAPGMMFTHNGKLLFSLPGVPFEMQYLIQHRVLPEIHQHFSLHAIVHRTVLTYGLPESELAVTIAPWESALPEDIKLAYLPNPKGVRLRLSAYCSDDSLVTRNKIETLFTQLQKIIPNAFIGYEEQQASLEGKVAELLIAQGSRLAIAESCTGGALSARFTAMPGASAYLLGSVVAYANEIKQAVLGVSKETLLQHGAVSRQTAIEMAEGIRRLTGAHYAIATTGIAGPDGGSPDKPVGTVWFAIATPYGTEAKIKHFDSLREPNIARACSFAIDFLRHQIQEQQQFSVK